MAEKVVLTADEWREVRQNVEDDLDQRPAGNFPFQNGYRSGARFVVALIENRRALGEEEEARQFVVRIQEMGLDGNDPQTQRLLERELAREPRRSKHIEALQQFIEETREIVEA